MPRTVLCVLCLICVLTVVSAVAWGQELPRVGFYDVDGHTQTYDVAIAGGYAYVPSGPAWGETSPSGLAVFDVSDSTRPRQVAYHRSAGASSPSSLTIVGDIGYLGYGRYSYLIESLDMSDSTQPRVLGSLSVGSHFYKPVISGPYLYTTSESGLRIADVSDPANMRWIGRWDALDAISVFAVEGSMVYTAAGDMLWIVDASDPTAPVQVGVYNAGNTIAAISVSAGYAYVGTHSDLSVIDVSTPAAPVQVGSYASPYGDPTRLALLGTSLYIVYGSGLELVDVSDPARPSLIGRCPVDGGAFAVADNRAYIVGDDYYRPGKFEVVDVSDPTQPVVVGAAFTMTREPRATAVSGSYGLLVDRVAGLEILTVANPALPTCVVTDTSLRGPESVYASAGYTYVGSITPTPTPQATLTVLDTENPLLPSRAGSCTVPGTSAELTVVGGHAYVAAGSGGLRVIDVSNPDAPVAVGVWSGGTAEEVAVAGGYAFVAAGDRGLVVVDVSDPSAPVEVSSYATPSDASCISLQGTHAYVGLQGSETQPPGLSVIDITDPLSPTAAGFSETASSVLDLQADSDFVYLALGTAGLSVIDVTDPAHITQVATFERTNLGSYGDVTVYAQQVTVAGGLVYLTDSGYGVYLLRTAPEFTDVSWDFWAYDAIQACAQAGLVQGFSFDDTYRPKGTVTRGQMAAYIARAMCEGEENVPTGPATPTFTDVGTDNGFYKHIEYAAAQGVVTGFSWDNTYRHQEPVTRGQMAAFLARAKCGGEELVPTGPATPSFPDVATDYKFYRHIEWILAHGITTGKADGLYDPEEACLRDQMAVFIGRAFLGLP